MKPILALLTLFVATGMSGAEALPESPEKIQSGYTDLVKSKWVHRKEPLTKGGLPFWFYADTKLAKDGKKHPLLIVLHGRRRDIPKNKTFSPLSIAEVWVDKKVYGKYPSFILHPYYQPLSGWEKKPEELDDLIRKITSNLPIDMERIYLVGLSNGAQGTFLSLARQPDWFAAGVTIAGPLLRPKEVVGKIKVPIWSWVGENDKTLNKNVRLPAMVKMLQKVDDRVKLNIAPNAGHGCVKQSFGNKKVQKWLFDQRLPR